MAKAHVVFCVTLSVLAVLILLLDLIFSLSRYSFHQLIHPRFYRDPFLSYRDVHPSPSAQFLASVQRGRNHMKSKSIVICSLCRDVEDCIEHTKQKLERIGSLFGKYKIVLFENDSADGTADSLVRWAEQNDRVTVLKCCALLGDCKCDLNTKKGYDLGWGSSERMAKMALYRNQYKMHVDHECSEYDYMMCYDFDLVGGIFLEGLIRTFDPRIEATWDAVCASGYQGMSMFQGFTMLYDSLAYVGMEQSFSAKTTMFKVYRTMNATCKKGIEHELVPIKSGFNGLAVYKIPSVRGIRYGSTTRCEHIDFHKQMYEQGKRMYQSPSMVLYTRQQGPEVSWSFVRDIVFKEL